MDKSIQYKFKVYKKRNIYIYIYIYIYWIGKLWWIWQDDKNKWKYG